MSSGPLECTGLAGRVRRAPAHLDDSNLVLESSEIEEVEEDDSSD